MINSDDDIPRYKISIGDFEDAIRFATGAAGHSADKIEHESLLLSAIIAYARPFGPNEKGKSPPISSSISIKNFALSEQELALHDRLIEWRNKAIAHSSFEHNPTSLVYGGIIVQSRRFSIVNVQVNTAGLIALAQKLHDICKKEYWDSLSRKNYARDSQPDEESDSIP